MSKLKHNKEVGSRSSNYIKDLKDFAQIIFVIVNPNVIDRGKWSVIDKMLNHDPCNAVG